MPIYEYKCLGCEKHFEKMQKVSDQPIAICESCGGKVEKQISRSGFQFKGSGWYVNDYASASSSKPDSGGSTPSTDSASKSSDTGGKKE